MFKKYHSIENHYRDRIIQKFLGIFPELSDELFVAYEKLDGANIQLFFQPNTKVIVGKRGSFLSEGESFYDIWNTLTKYEKEINQVQSICDNTGVNIRLYGEIYGHGIQKRIDYGPDKKIAIFDCYINDKLMTKEELQGFLEIKHLLPMNLGEFNGLANALNFDVELDNIEGVVITPYSREFIDNSGDRFILKKKSEKFKEIEDSAPLKEKVEQSENVTHLMMSFRGYINKNRVLSIFSKHGKINNPKQIGQYILLILEDAKEDFRKDFDTTNLTQKEEKVVYNVGGMICNYLKMHL